MVGIENYSPVVKEIKMFLVNGLQIAFIDADTAEGIDDKHPNFFWFFENYNPKRKYHFIYSNSRMQSSH